MAPGGGASAYLWPAAAGVCYDLSPVGSGCMPLARIAHRGLDVAVLAEVSPASGRYLHAPILGIVRDGIRSAATLRAPPVAVRWRDDDLVRTVPVRALSPREIASLR